MPSFSAEQKLLELEGYELFKILTCNLVGDGRFYRMDGLAGIHVY